MAIYGKGINQITTRSVASKNFCCKLDTAFKKLNAIYEKSVKQVQQVIQEETMLGFDMDNYNRIISKRVQTDEKSAIMHKGTASFIVRQKVPALPIGTNIASPLGIKYRVVNCKRETPYRIFIKVELDESTIRPMTAEQLVEFGGMSDDMLFPSVGFQGCCLFLPCHVLVFSSIERWRSTCFGAINAECGIHINWIAHISFAASAIWHCNFWNTNIIRCLPLWRRSISFGIGILNFCSRLFNWIGRGFIGRYLPQRTISRCIHWHHFSRDGGDWQTANGQCSLCELLIQSILYLLDSERWAAIVSFDRQNKAIWWMNPELGELFAYTSTHGG